MASNGDLEDVIKKIKPHKWDFTTKKKRSDGYIMLA
jgi:hypothetical protein